MRRLSRNRHWAAPMVLRFSTITIYTTHFIPAKHGGQFCTPKATYEQAWMFVYDRSGGPSHMSFTRSLQTSGGGGRRDILSLSFSAWAISKGSQESHKDPSEPGKEHVDFRDTSSMIDVPITQFNSNTLTRSPQSTMNKTHESLRRKHIPTPLASKPYGAENALTLSRQPTPPKIQNPSEIIVSVQRVNPLEQTLGPLRLPPRGRLNQRAKTGQTFFSHDSACRTTDRTGACL